MTNKKATRALVLMFFGALILTIIFAQGIGAVVDVIKAHYGIGADVQIAKAPVADLTPVTSDSDITEEDLQKLVLNPKPYTPTANVGRDRNAYKNESIRLIFDGEFSQAQLRISGNVTESGPHFLDVVFGNVVGTLYAARYSATTFNTTLTQQYGGVFTNATPIDVTIDLFKPVQLATTQSEYEKTQQASKIVSLWNANPHSPPPIDISLLVAPFNQKGIFGGAAIVTTFAYECKEKGRCHVAICPTGKAASLCMVDAFGPAVANDWCKRTNSPNCSFKSN